MGADRNVVITREDDRRSHRVVIAGVSAAGDIDRRQERNEPGIVADAFPDVAIEIDQLCTIAKHPCNFSLIPVSAGTGGSSIF